MDDFRKCPITPQLLSPVGFPLEQLSVSVSLGKSPKYTTHEEVLALNSDLHIHMWQCSRSASWGSFQTSNFFKFCSHTRVQAMGGLSVPEQVRPLAPPLPGLFLLSCLSVWCGRFSVDGLVVDERRVADHCWSSRCCPPAPARLHIPAGSCYSGDMKQLESDEFSNWWLKGADAAFIQLVRSSLLQILLDKKRWAVMEVTWTEGLLFLFSLFLVLFCLFLLVLLHRWWCSSFSCALRAVRLLYRQLDSNVGAGPSQGWSKEICERHSDQLCVWPDLILVRVKRVTGLMALETHGWPAT